MGQKSNRSQHLPLHGSPNPNTVPPGMWDPRLVNDSTIVCDSSVPRPGAHSRCLANFRQMTECISFSLLQGNDKSGDPDFRLLEESREKEFCLAIQGSDCDMWE